MNAAFATILTAIVAGAVSLFTAKATIKKDRSDEIWALKKQIYQQLIKSLIDFKGYHKRSSKTLHETLDHDRSSDDDPFLSKIIPKAEAIEDFMNSNIFLIGPHVYEHVYLLLDEDLNFANEIDTNNNPHYFSNKEIADLRDRHYEYSELYANLIKTITPLIQNELGINANSYFHKLVEELTRAFNSCCKKLIPVISKLNDWIDEKSKK